ncbi:hypothetical protein [Natrinema gari]|uniref:hypothetical protein n=1 Tax=Natrinema gari TaxID=419186 RepID=UPI001F4CE7E3|nr:hypothetical protein [Natrinema gari]
MTDLQSRFECVAQQTARYEDGSVSVSIKRALDVLGQAGVAQAVRFAETEDGFLVGELVGSKLDGRENPMGRNIKDPGGDLRVMIPPAAFDHLEIDKEQVREGNADIDVWVCSDPDVDPSVIGISPHIRQVHTVDLEPLLGDSE